LASNWLIAVFSKPTRKPLSAVRFPLPGII
jgi:hypothetical protein